MKTAYKNASLLNSIVATADWLTFNLALLLCFQIGWWPVSNIWAWLIFNISYVIAHGVVLITLHKRWSTLATIMRNASRSSLLIIILNAAILGMAHMTVPGFFRSATVGAVIFIVMVVERVVLRHAIKYMRFIGRNSIHAVIVGYGEMTNRVIRVMNDRWNGYNLIGVFDDDRSKASMCYSKNPDYMEDERCVPYLGKVEDVIEWLTKNHVDEIYIGLGNEYDNLLKPLLKICAHYMIRIYYIPLSSSTVRREARILEFGDTYVMTQYNEPLLSGRNRMLKRTFDVLFSLVFLCTMFPFIYIIVFIVSKITMPGPVFFKQKRTGYDGRDFYCYKFRSMKINKDSDKVQATKHDPRVTKWGSIMRHTNIDELPQFINVLKGDMSIVGPRPHMLAHTEYYSNRIGDYMIRHYVRPGITGWAQTHGERGETQTVDDMARRVEKDIWYIEHWNFWLDIQVIIKTVQDAVVGDKKAY